MLERKIFVASQNFDVVIVGCGHAGLEAAIMASRVGAKTAVITSDIDAIGRLSCNPSIGGVGKSHLVKEIDALGGIMGQLADVSCIHKRTLNSSKGPSVRSTRFQIDRQLYKRNARQLLESSPNLFVIQDSVINFNRVDNKFIVNTNKKIKLTASTIVLAVGTFLNSKIHLGEKKDCKSKCESENGDLSFCLESLGFLRLRLKTGTPARVDSKTVNFKHLESQLSDSGTLPFSFVSSSSRFPKQSSCWMTFTTTETKDIILQNISMSPTFKKDIVGSGPRYCLSIEEKIVRFPLKSSHLIFVEPESLTSSELYLNGLSSCLPTNIQSEIIKSLGGLKDAHITRFGHAIEYDCFSPKFLRRNLESKIVAGLYFAGQVNGTTGYEEAAAQGLVAGLNAASFSLEREQWFPDRNNSYIGVLISDLVRNGITEPYRIFTSRSEERLFLREDNADLRLCPTAKRLGILSKIRWDLFCLKRELLNFFSESKLSRYWKTINLEGITLSQQSFRSQILNQIINSEEVQSHKNKRSERLESSVPLPFSFDFNLIRGLSAETAQKLNTFRPQNIEQVSKLEGITPTALNLLFSFFKKPN